VKLSEFWYAIKHTFQKDSGICPRCGYNAFEHGFHPDERYFCSKCGLWEPEDVKIWREKNEMSRV